MDSNQLKNQIEQVANLSINSDDGNDKNRSKKTITCAYCAITRANLRQHCQTETHQNVIINNQFAGIFCRDWKCRAPPRGYTADKYTLCESFLDNGTCHYGNQCFEAHGNDELHEWQERFEYRKMRMQRACEKELFGKRFTEQLLEKWVTAATPDRIMKEKIDGAEETCSNDLMTTVSSKVSKREWTFVLKTKRMLKAVALLQDAHRNHFMLKQVFAAEPRPAKRGQSYGHKVVEAELISDQEWIVPNPNERYSEVPTERSPILEHRVKVVFSTDIYGTVRQSVVFDFGTEPVLVKHFCVDVIPVTDADKVQEIKKEMVVSASQRWDESNAQILPYQAAPTPHQPNCLIGFSSNKKLDEEREKELIQRYPCPRASTFTLTQCRKETDKK